MHKQALITVFSFLVISTSFAQKYTTAAGIRVGSGIGLTVQQHLWDKYTLEVSAQKNLFKSGTYTAAFFEQHHKLIMKGFNFYLGAGPHAEFKPSETVYDSKGQETTVSNNAYGISGVVGLELRLRKLLLSYDYQPGINIHGGDHVLNSRTGISVRYIFIKAKKKEQKWMFWKKMGNKGDK